MSIASTSRRRAALPAAGRSRRFRVVGAFASVGFLAVAFLSALLAVGAAPAQAHAELTGSDPRPEQVLAQSPRSIRLTFSEPVRVAATGTKLLGADGRQVKASATATDSELVLRPAQPLTNGSWLASWRVTSADGHPISGALTFSVGAPSSGSFGDAVAADVERREVNLVRMVAASARYLGFAVAIGLALFAGFVWRRPTLAPGDGDNAVVQGVQSALERWSLAGLGLGLLGHLVLVPAQAVWIGGGSWSSVGDSAVWKESQDGFTMLVLIMLVFTAVLGSLALRRRSASLAVVATGLLIVAWAAEGHTRTVTPSWLVVGADAVHIGAAVFWIGGLVGLTVLLRGRLSARESAAVVSRFSAAALVSVLAVAAAGVVLFWRIAPQWSALWETGYGRIVLAKLAVVLVPVAVLAAWNRWTLVPGVSTEAGRARLLRSVRVEAGLLAVVLCLTGVLVAQSPRTDGSSPVDTSAPVAAGAETLHLALGQGRHAMVTIDPVRRGRNKLSLTLTDREGKALPLVGEVSVSATQREADVGPLPVTLQVRAGSAGGGWTGTVDLPIKGRWKFSVSVPLTEFETPVVSAEVFVP